jgi:hypothetical protein
LTRFSSPCGTSGVQVWPAAGQLYGVQEIPVTVPVHVIEIGMQPELANAVKPRTKPRTTLYFKRDMTTPFVEKKCFTREG